MTNASASGNLKHRSSIRVTTPAFRLMKRLAKAYKKEHQCSHCQALDIIAKRYNFLHWGEVVDGNNAHKATEDAFYHGVIIGFDWSETDIVDEDCLIPDEYLSDLIKPSLFEHIENSTDDEDPEGRLFKDSLDERTLSELQEENLFSLRLYIAQMAEDHPTLSDVKRHVSKHSFFAPEYIWIKGQIYSLWE